MMSQKSDVRPAGAAIPASLQAGTKRAASSLFFVTLRNGRVRVGALIILPLIAMALLAGVIAPQDPLLIHADAAFTAPGHGGYLLGSDEYGRDVLSRLLYGARISLRVAIASVLIAASGGILLGLLAGYYGGWVDVAIMRATDVMLAFPPILLAIAVLAFLGNSQTNLILTIGILYMSRFVRVVYSAVNGVKHHEYVASARIVGASDGRIIRTAILPNVLAPILVQVSLSLGFAILLEAGLSFLGLGAPPPTPSWGVMLASGRDYMDTAPTLVVWPSLAVALVVIAFNFLGDGLRDALDPQLRRS